MNEHYPTIRISQCLHFNIFSMSIGPWYCKKCNAIILCVPHYKKRFEIIVENIVEIINHETMHWILLKEVDNQAASFLDNIVKYDGSGL